MTPRGSGDDSSVKSARRVLEILEVLAANPDGMQFLQIAKVLELPKSSLYALLATLLRQGWIALDESSRIYRVGVRAWEVGQGYRRAHDLALVADPHLRAARAELGETVQLGILDGVDVVYIAKVESDRPFRLVSRVGMRLPAWATGLGKVLLASLPPDALRHRMTGVTYRRFTDNTICSLEELERVLIHVRSEGIGRDRGEYTAFVHCIAAPVRDQTGNVVAAISCSMPQAPADKSGGDGHIVEVLVRHATALSKSLGWEQSG